MLAYYGSHILHTAVAYFDVVLVEKGVILVLLREVFRYELTMGSYDGAEVCELVGLFILNGLGNTYGKRKHRT